MNIQEFRTQYPDYKDMSDMELARKLHAKDYADMPFEDFATRFGLQQRFGGATAGMTFPYQGVPGIGRLEGERPFIGEVGAALTRGAMSVGAGFTGTLSSLLAKPDMYRPGLEDLWMSTPEQQVELSESLKTATEKIRSAQEHFQRTWEGSGGWALNVVSETIPYMGAALAGGYVVGPIGAAIVGFSVEGQNAYEDAIKSGATEKQADTERAIVGSLNAAIEALQIGRLMKFQKTGKHSIIAFKDLIKKKAYKQLAKAGGQFTKDVLKNAVEEGLEEFGQEGVSISVPAILRGEYPKKPDGSPDIWAIGERLGAATLGGTVAGGILGAGGAVTLAAPGLAAPSAMRAENLAETIHSAEHLSEIEKAMMLRDLKETLPEGHVAKKQQPVIFQGVESKEIFVEQQKGEITREEQVPIEKPVTFEVGQKVRPTDRNNIGTIEFIDEETKTAKVYFYNRKTGLQDRKTFPLKQLKPYKKQKPEMRTRLVSRKTGEELQTIGELPIGTVNVYRGKETGRIYPETPGGGQTRMEEVQGKETIIGICKDTSCVEDIFGSVSEFARQIELQGDEFVYQGVKVTYDENTDTHTFLTAPETRTRIVSTETGEELELDKDLTAKAVKEARPPTIFDIPEATQKTLDAAKKVADVLLELEPMRGELKEKMEAKKHAIWKVTEDIVKKLSPEQGHIFARKQAMTFAKKTLKEVMPDLKTRITADEHESLQRAINEASLLNEGQKMNLTETLKELFVDRVQPDKSHIELFDQFFGTQILKTAKRVPPKKWWKKWLWYTKEAALEGMGAIKASVTSFDLSAGGIQAWPNFFVNPKQWWMGEGVGIRAALSEKYNKLLDIEMKTDPDYRRIVVDGKLPITEVGSLTKGEELFRRGHYAQKIPVFGIGVTASERAYTANLNYQRFAIAKKVLESWDGAEVNYDKDRELMDHIGNMTGRGKGKPSGWFEKFMELWSFGFWSPRLYKSVVNLPIEFITKPHIRKIAAHDAVQFFGLMGLITYLASLIPGVEREDDPRSTDFWKLKYGNTRYNPMGRYQQLARLIGQVWMGQTKSVTTGRIYEKERVDIATRYLRGKLAPGPAMSWDILTGETYKGEKITWDEASITKYLAEHVSPLFLQDMVDALRFQGLDSSTPFTFTLGVAGIGTQTYEITPKQEEIDYKNQLAYEYFGQNWDDIGEEAQTVLRATRPSIVEYERTARYEQEDMSIRGVIAQEALNAGNRVQRNLSRKVQEEMETLQVRVGELKRYSGKGWYLNQPRFKQFQDEMSKILGKWASAMVESETWAAIPVEGKRSALEHAISESRKIAWQIVKNQANAEDFERRGGIINERETTGAVAVK